MKWNVRFYDHRVMKEIEAWPIGIKAKFTWIVDLIEEIGPREIGMPHIKSMKKGLFEIRAQAKEGIGRAFFCIKKRQNCNCTQWIHKKNSKNAPKRD